MQRRLIAAAGGPHRGLLKERSIDLEARDRRKRGLGPTPARSPRVLVLSGLVFVLQAVREGTRKKRKAAESEMAKLCDAALKERRLDVPTPLSAAAAAAAATAGLPATDSIDI